MQLPLQITFRNMEASPAMEGLIREKAAKLDRYHNHIMSCRVMVEARHRHRHKGVIYHVRLDITVPGKEIVISREPELDHAHEDVYVAIRDAFDAARRRLEDAARKERSEIKHREVPPHGRIQSLNPQRGYGYIFTSEGREVYFHRNAVMNGDFERLEAGSEVRFHLEETSEGPRATSVYLVGKHHPVV